MNKDYYDIETADAKYEFYDLNIIPIDYISLTNHPQIVKLSFNFSKGIKIDDNGSVNFSVDDLELYKEVMVEILNYVEPELRTELFIYYQSCLEEYYDE